MQNKCPKCGKIFNSKSKNKKEKKNVNLLSLNLLFGFVSLKRNKKASCDLCGSKIKRK